MTADALSPDEARVVEEELTLLRRVQGVLAGGLEVGPEDTDRDAELLALRDQLAESRAEDHAALVEHMLRVAALRNVSGRARGLPVDPTSPYFAHVRLREGEVVHDLLVGRRAYLDRKRGVQIVDWRNSPISRIYYRYEEGDDYEEAFPGGVRRGVVELRRTLTIEDGRLVRVRSGEQVMVRGDDGWRRLAAAITRLAGGQGAALRAPDERLGRTGPDHRLPEITALIDPAQFAAITQERSGVVVITGGAGTGKTTIALHRAAWLHFQDPGRFTPSRMRVLTPGAALARYVARVLPALDVRGVPVDTFPRWVLSQVRQLVPALRKRQTTDDTPNGARRLKRHPAMVKVLEDALSAAADALDDAFGEAGGAELREAWRAERGRPPMRRLDALERWVAGTPLANRPHVRRLLDEARATLGDPVDLWANTLTHRERLATGLLKHGAGPKRWELDHLVDAVAKQADDPPDYSAIDADRRQAVDGRDLEEGELRGRLDVDDLALVLRIGQMQHGVQRGPGGSAPRLEHLVVDEAQDLAPVHVQVAVGAVRAGAPVTLAGDTQQRIRFDSGFDDWDELLSTLEVDAHILPPLAVTYRSTRQVMAFAHHVLGTTEPEGRLAREGAPVELLRFTEVGEAVGFLADALSSLRSRERRATVALIARTPEIADLWYEGLARAAMPDLRRIRAEEFDFSPGVDVTDVFQVKGLEYDYVVLLQVTAQSYPDDLESRHLLHVGATRAAHQLWLVAAGTPSPLLPTNLLEM